MPYALVPDGFTLKKVTKAQEKAVDAKRNASILESLAGNELAVTAIVAPIIAIVTGTLGTAIVDLVINKLQGEGVKVTDKVKEEVKAVVSGTQTAVGVVQEAVETGKIGASIGSPVAVDVADLPEELFKEALRRVGWKV